MAEETIDQWLTSQDGLESLRVEQAPMPIPTDNEVLVKISTVALNYRDTEGRFRSIVSVNGV